MNVYISLDNFTDVLVSSKLSGSKSPSVSISAHVSRHCICTIKASTPSCLSAAFLYRQSLAEDQTMAPPPQERGSTFGEIWSSGARFMHEACLFLTSQLHVSFIGVALVVGLCRSYLP
jgi:hypothetical protein